MNRTARPVIAGIFGPAVLLAVCLLIGLPPANADSKLTFDIAADNAKQRVWASGRAAPGVAVAVLDGDREVGSATSGDNGIWRTAIKSSRFGGTHVLRARIGAADGVASFSAPIAIYVVRPGDTFSVLARKFYGDSRRFLEIARLNAGAVGGPDLILAGQIIVLPDPPTARPLSAAEVATATPPDETPAHATPTIEVAFQTDDGTSILSGSGDPGAQISVMADGETLGTVTPDESGNWWLSSKRTLGAAPQLALRQESADGVVVEIQQAAEMTIALTPAAGPTEEEAATEEGQQSGVDEATAAPEPQPAPPEPEPVPDETGGDPAPQTEPTETTESESDLLPPPPPPTDGDAYQAALAKRVTGAVAFNVPPTMTVGETAGIQAVISFDKAEAAVKERIEEAGEVRVREIMVSNVMSAELIGTAFTITPSGAQKRIVDRVDGAEWNWQVRANESGDQDLWLEISAIITIDGQSSPATTPPFKEKIEVQVAEKPAIDKFWELFDKPLGRILALGSLIVMLYGGYRWLRSRKSAKPAPPAAPTKSTASKTAAGKKATPDKKATPNKKATPKKK